jgi:hypothetical protein
MRSTCLVFVGFIRVVRHAWRAWLGFGDRAGAQSTQPKDNTSRNIAPTDGRTWTLTASCGNQTRSTYSTQYTACGMRSPHGTRHTARVLLRMAESGKCVKAPRGSLYNASPASTHRAPGHVCPFLTQLPAGAAYLRRPLPRP